MTQEKGDDTRSLQRALERTVPASEFGGEATRAELERTRQDQSPELTPQQFLRRTGADTPATPTECTDAPPDLGTTSLVPPDLLDEHEESRRRFELIEQVGSGGTAKVYAVRDTALGRTIALKLLHGRKADRAGTKRRFLHEARVTAMLEHPNIVPVHDIGVTDKGRVYFLMKNVTGTTAGEAIRAAKTGESVPEELDTVDGMLRVILKVCDALAYAHSRGFVHQDVKPDNIILGDFGEVLLLDWGCAIAKELQDSAGTATFGTPAYMSPEQARREAVDERSDVYCVGGTLYHMLTLRHPTFENEPELFWEMKRRGELSVLPPENERRAPPALLDIARRAMAPDRSERYQSVIALRDAILEYQTHAESIALAQKTAEGIPQAEQQADYAALTEISGRLSQALEMWPGNAEARAALVRARRAHAQCALTRGELALVESLVAQEPALADLRGPLEQARRKQAQRQRRARYTVYAAVLLGLLTLAFFGHGVVDYFRYFGSWQPVYRAELTGDGEPVEEMAVSRNRLTRDEPTTLVTGPRGLTVPDGRMVWLRDVHERGDVRFEVLLRWPERVDGFEMHINIRREQPAAFWHVPTGYSCQFGGWNGTVNFISRNDRPQPPNSGNAVSASFEPGRVYRLGFQRAGERISLFVDREEVLSILHPLPIVGRGLDRIAFRSWIPVEILAIEVWRMGTPAKTSPIIAGDVLVELGQLGNAVHVYRRTAADHPGTRIAEQALTRAYLLAGDLPRGDTVRQAVRTSMREQYPGSRYWPLLFEADCEQAWRRGAYDTAMAMATAALDRDPDSRIALRLLSRRPRDLPPATAHELLHLLRRSSKIRTIDISNMNVTDLSPLRGMDLVSLDCSHCDIVDLSPLRGMRLKRLLIGWNRVTSLEPLRGMPLQDLQCGHNDIVDLGPLAGMPLRRLTCPRNRISDLTPLRGAPLVTLHCHGNIVESIEPLRGMPVHNLVITANRVTDLAPLAGMPLRDLECSYNRIGSIDALRRTPLDQLRIDSCGVSDLSPLRGMPLTTLSFDRNHVRDISPLRGMPLAELQFAENRVSSLEPLRGMPLVTLNCSENAVGSIEPLRDAPLRRLRASGNRVRDLSPLAEAPLEFLMCHGNPLADLAPFEAQAPSTFSFDSVDAGASYVDSVLRTWAQRGDSSNARLARAMIAVRRGRLGELQSLAVPYRGRRYLFLAHFVTIDEAHRLARAAGAHLVTITDREERNFVRGITPRRRTIWLGLDRSNGTNRWVTGEPFSYHDFDKLPPNRDRAPAIQLNSASGAHQWVTVAKKGWKEGVVLEWDGRSLGSLATELH